MSDQDQPRWPSGSILAGVLPTPWSTQDTARFEAAYEVLAQLTAALTEQITAEENVAEPDQDRIAALSAEQASLVVIRQQLEPTDKAAVDRILRDLGPKAGAALRR
jgi:hypothetical protein